MKIVSRLIYILFHNSISNYFFLTEIVTNQNREIKMVSTNNPSLALTHPLRFGDSQCQTLLFIGAEKHIHAELMGLSYFGLYCTKNQWKLKTNPKCRLILRKRHYFASSNQNPIYKIFIMEKANAITWRQ